MRMQSCLNVLAGGILGWMGGCIPAANHPSTRLPGLPGMLSPVVTAPRLAPGTVLTVRLGDPVSSATARRGDAWSGVLVRDLVATDGSVVEAGGAVDGIVSEARAASRVRSALDLRVISVSAHGRIASVRAELDPAASGNPSVRGRSIVIHEGVVLVFKVQ